MNAKTLFGALLSGTLFGLGLAISGMTNPAKVIGFLDVAGNWDPTLAFVMGAGVLVNLVAFRLTMKRPAPLFAAAFQLPKKDAVDLYTVLGAVLFGLGWGIGGLCPGPGIASLGFGAYDGSGPFEPRVLVFLASLLAGMALYVVTLGRVKR